jgi:hypothetical protein
MNNPSNAESPILAEGGVVITRTHISAGGQTFEFAKVHSVEVEKTPQFLMAVLIKRPQPTGL